MDLILSRSKTNNDDEPTTRRDIVNQREHEKLRMTREVDLKTTTTMKRRQVQEFVCHNKRTKLSTQFKQINNQGGDDRLLLLMVAKNSRAKKSSSTSCSANNNSSRNFLLPKLSSHNNSLATILSLAFALILCISTTTISFQAEAIKLQPEGREKFYWSGEQFVITCQNNNNIKNVKIRWIGPNGLDITEDRSQRVHAESTGPHGHRLVVMNATASTDDGQYKCTLGSTDDRNPREHIEFNLKIYRTTSFKDTARHLVLPVGKQGTLDCRVEFDPGVVSASISWVRDQIPIEMSNDTNYKVYDYDPDRQLSQLTLFPVKKQSDGVYTCRAVAVTSQLSKISDHDIHLETNYAPSFEKDTHIVWVERSQSMAYRQRLLATTGDHQTTNVYGHGGGGYLPMGARPGYPHSTVGRTRLNKPSVSISSAGASSGGKSTVAQSGGAAGSGGRSTSSVASSVGSRSGSVSSGSVSSGSVSSGSSRKGRELSDEEETQKVDGLQMADNFTAAAAGPQVVRVELRCTCQANPPATIMWTSSHNSQFVLAKGAPAHVLEEPSTEVEGHNTTSVLVVGYNLDLDWEHKRDQYRCSASNKLGATTKTFTIEQGDPPPAFSVGPDKQYNPETSLFKFTLSGPDFDPDNTDQNSALATNVNTQQQHQEIVPPVDSFRIRAESPSSGESKASYWSSSRRQNEPSVQWSPSYHHYTPQQQLVTPQNYTINLGRLPSGNQKLYLEAHNAVGWSPNATYLGDYYIVSGATSLLSFSSVHLQGLAVNLFGCLLISCLVVFKFQPGQQSVI